jgi:hypothetical protein
MHPSDDLLNDLADDALAAAERATIEGHVATCERCGALVEELRELRRAAGRLGPIEPPPHVWHRIERHLPRGTASSGASSGPARGLLYGSHTWWLAAAALLLLATIVGLRFGPGYNPSPGDSAAAPADADLAQAVEAELQQAEQHYQRAITGLEQIATREQGELDPQTAALLQKNLAVIDQAISESRAALKVEPESEPAQQSLLESFKQKVALLQATVALINEMRTGDEAGAARVISGAQ